MTVNINNTGLKVALDGINPNQLSDALRSIGLGSIVRRLSTTLRRQNPNAQAAGVGSVYDLATLQTIFLPDDAKAKSISRVCARANSGSVANGELTVAATYVTPTTTQVGVSPAGNIVFLGSDEYTDVDIDYTPADQDVTELILPCTSSVAVIPVAAFAGTAGAGTPTSPAANAVNNVAGVAGVNMAMEIEALVGTTIGKCVVVAPGSAPGSAHQANLDITKSKVQFHTADAVTSCRIKFGFFRAIDLNALLEANSLYF